MRRIAATGLLLALAGPALAAGTPHFEGSQPKMESNTAVTFDNLRFSGTGYSTADAYRQTYTYDAVNKRFVLSSSATYKGIGVYSDWLFVRDMPIAQPTFTVGGQTYATNQSYTFTATRTAPLVQVFALKAGHVMSWRLSGITADFKLSVIGPGNKTLFSFRGGANTNVITLPVPIMADGTYKFMITPDTASTMSIRIYASNANSATYKTVVSGNSLTSVLRTNVRDYTKFRVVLNKGDTLRLPAGATNIALRLIDGYGKVLANPVGLPLIYTAPATGTYSVFVYNASGWGGTYSGTLKITAASAGNAVASSDEGDMLSATPAR
ncbi:hypothetical protein [Oryzibacter oryziterrae]|uniref:hypothetical protein n=1 Tax=Oryzibacter oryziterrae TaxID=2766474 RepID=UPI001F4770AF|nr:hypothetical protein [Oryzibacter oryziterrae]